MKHLYQELNEFFSRLYRARDDEEALAEIKEDDYFKAILETCEDIVDLKKRLKNLIKYYKFK